MRFILIGSGNIAKTYLKAFTKIDASDIVGFVSSKDQKPSYLSHLPSFKSLSEVNVPYEAVIIATPNGTHHFLALEAAALGKHILCEKVLDITLEAMDAMIAGCRENNVKLGVAYQRRFSSDNPVVKKLIEEGKLGRIFSVDLAVRNYRNQAYYDSASYRGTYALDGGGPFIQQAAHYIDLYCWFFGMPKEVLSRLGTFVHEIEVEDHGAVLCVHDSGIISTITASTACKPGFGAKMEIYSEKGYLVMENDVITRWEVEGMENPSLASEYANTHSGSATSTVEDTTNHELVIKDFIDAVVHDRAPLISGEEGKIASEMIVMIYNK
jgi:predicted dehydrogenase